MGTLLVLSKFFLVKSECKISDNSPFLTSNRNPILKMITRKVNILGSHNSPIVSIVYWILILSAAYLYNLITTIATQPKPWNISLFLREKKSKIRRMSINIFILSITLKMIGKITFNLKQWELELKMKRTTNCLSLESYNTMA